MRVVHEPHLTIEFEARDVLCDLRGGGDRLSWEMQLQLREGGDIELKAQEAHKERLRCRCTMRDGGNEERSGDLVNLIARIRPSRANAR
jgi:hypothetical protein